MQEGNTFDKKSIRALVDITKRSPDWDEIAKDCVAFANVPHGGIIRFWVEDDKNIPPVNQKIPKDLLWKIQKNILARTFNVAITPTIQTHPNGWEYLDVKVYPSLQTIAATTSGKYYIRIADECRPVMPEDLGRLMMDKGAFVWELQTSKKVPLDKIDTNKRTKFLLDIRNSERVSSHIKSMTNEEVLDYYFLTKDGYLTNLWILWIGERVDRAGLLYAPVIQFIKKNANGETISKTTLDDFSLNPQEMLENIMELSDWREYIEISDGLFRKNIPYYDPEVVRELIVNAIVHRVYTMRGDIFINMTPESVSIHSPGPFPVWVTPSNAIAKTIRRNEHLAKTFYDLRLMEREGTGFDTIFEKLLVAGKSLPKIESYDDRVVVTIYNHIKNIKVLELIDQVNTSYWLKPRELISLGLIAQSGSLSSREIAKILAIDDPNGIVNWIGRLKDLQIIESTGKTSWMQYFVAPQLLRTNSFKTKTTLKRIEPNRLRELIWQDLRDYPESAISDIHKRIGTEISLSKLRRELDMLKNEWKIYTSWKLRWTRYSIDQNAGNSEVSMAQNYIQDE